MILKIVDNIIYIETTSESHLSIQLPSINVIIYLENKFCIDL